VSPLRALAAASWCAALAWAVGWGSQAPFRVEPRADAAIRLSWRAPSRPVEACRTSTPEELAKLPVHMRRPEICERRLSAFHLMVTLDARAVIDERVEPKGAQRDRPAHVLHELRVPPGPHRLAVRFAPEAEAAGPPLTLDAELALAPRAVALVTEAAEGSRLELRFSSPAAGTGDLP
jgi:hypothetical protein